LGKRRENWTPEDDKILIQLVQQFVHEGKTQLAAFEEAAEQLRRSSAACAFRWNSKLRKITAGEQTEQTANVSTNKRKAAVKKSTEDKNIAPDFTDIKPMAEITKYLLNYEQQVTVLKQLLIEKENEIAQLKERLSFNIPAEELKKLMILLNYSNVV
jgi:RsfA family transcription factor